MGPLPQSQNVDKDFLFSFLELFTLSIKLNYV